MKRTVLVLFLSTLAACSLLAAKPDHTRNYVLTEESQSRAADQTDLVLAVGPIDLPAYLARAEIVTREASNRLRFSSLDRWAEPLEENFARVFRADLGQTTGAGQIVGFPPRFQTDVDYRVQIGVERFERDAGNVVVLRAKWELIRGSHGDVIHRDRSVHEVPIEGTDTAGAVAALSRATSLLAQEVGAALRSITGAP